MALKKLLHFELDRYGEVRGHRVAVQLRRIIPPVAKRIHGRLLQERRSGNDLHAGDAPGGIHQGINLHVAANALRSGNGRINRRNGRNQSGGFDIPANG